MLSTIHSVSINGLQATRVLIEVNLEKLNAQRDPFFVMVGLPDNAVKESRTRVRTALQNSGKFLPWQVVTISIDGTILDR